MAQVAVLARKLHDVVHDQEIRLVLQVGDQLQLVLDLRLNVDRDAGRETLTDIQRAARFFYLRHHAFGGLVAGQTFGTAPAINLLRIEENLSAAHLRLAAGTTIENLPWSECLRRYDCAHTFFYADPPYWQTEGYGVPFEWAEYERLAEAMRLSKGKMMLSINDHPDIRACFAGLPKYELSMRYSVANKEGKSKESGELVILNYEPSLMGDLLSGGHDPQE